MSETWRRVPGFPAYEISDAGNLRSVTRFIKYQRTVRLIRGQRKAGRPQKNGGHLRVALYNDSNVRNAFIHQLVMEAFVGPCPPGLCVRHLNGQPRDNRLENLVYGTPRENWADMRVHETAPIGERSPASKMTADKVREIRLFARDPRITQRHLADLYQVTAANITCIVRRQTWVNVEDHV